MPPPKPQTDMVLSGWQGITVETPPNWNIGAISGDASGGYVRYDDDEMPRLEIKWSSDKGFVDLNTVIDKYLKDLQKNRKKKAPKVEVDRDVKLISKRKRKKGGLKCFHWQAENEGYGAAWTCRDCSRTVIAQVMAPVGQAPEEARELAGNVLLSIDDHPTDGWVLWSAYGFSCYAPEDFKVSGQKLMAGLIELEFEKDTEKIKMARWGMANVALKKKTLEQWIGGEAAKELRKHKADREQTSILGHDGLTIEGSNIGGLQLLHRFYLHCTDKPYADRLIARAWHCEETNRIYYVETYVDRANVGLADELVARIECHPGVHNGARDDEKA